VRRIESWLDNAADRRTGSNHTKEWYAYLRTAFVCEPIGRRYIRTLVTRLKFELGTSIAALIAAVGITVLWIDGYSSCRLSLILIFLTLLVAGYLGFAEAPASHRLLATAPQPAGRGFIIVEGTQIPVVELHDTLLGP
jgi:hypothetical protein